MYKTIRLRGGAVVQAGMNATGRHYFDRITPKRAPYRAVVVNTFVEDSDGRSTSRRRAKVLCDVILVRSQIQLQRVQVEQRLGMNNAQLWIPRPTTRRVSTGDGVQLQRRSNRGTVAGEPTPFDDMDGDVVLIDFIEGDIDYPIIRGAMEHERTFREVLEGSGWSEGNGGSERGTAYKDESYRRWAGTEERINAEGDYLLDTVGATDDIVQEQVDADGGQIRFRVKSERRFTVEMDGTDVLEVFVDGGQVRIDLGEGAAQRLVLGDDFRTFLNDWLTNVFAQHQHTAGTLVAGMVSVTGLSGAVSPVTVPPLVPPPPLSYTGSQMSEDLLSDLAKTKKS